MENPVAIANGPTFGERHFGAAELGDQRRTRRLVQLADRMVMHPGGTLPQKLAKPADLKAMYRLMDTDAVTRAERLQPAIALLSVIALSLLQRRDASRRPDANERPATAFIHRDYVVVLSLWRHRELRPDWSLHDFYYALAR